MATKKTEVIKIQPLVEKTAVIRVEGLTPLITSKWSEKAKGMLPAGKRAKEIATGKKSVAEKKDEYAGPMEQFINSMYWISHKPEEYTEEAFAKAIADGAEFGMKAEAFKAAAIDAAYTKKWIPNKKGVKGVFFIEPDFTDEEGSMLVKIHGSIPEIREDIVRLAGISRSADLRWRGMFNVPWWCDLKIKYDADGIYSLEDIINMINVGGRYNGIGEWRPEHDGQFGMYQVVEKK